MKKWYSILCMALLFIGVTSCSEEEDIVKSTNKQTILVFMPWSGSQTSKGLYGALKVNVDSICSAIVKMGGMDGRVMLYMSESYDTSNLYEIVYNSSTASCDRNLIKSYTGHDHTTVEGLTSILNTVKDKAEALNYAMVVGCHGTGWTFKESWQYYPYYAKQTGWQGAKGRMERIPYQNYDVITDKHTRFFGSISQDGISTYSIDIPTLAEAISNAGMKMQYILFDDCYMANVEVAYELREVTNFLVASTSEMMASGIPYQTMWKSMASATPSYSTMISAFDTYIKNYDIPYGTYSAIDCRKMEELAIAMRDINNTYTTLHDTVRAKIQVLDGFDVPIFYDMGDYLKNLCTNAKAYSHVSTVLTSAIKAKCYTDSIYSYIYGYPEFIKVNTFSGITISDPSINSVALDGKEKTSWWKATHQ